MGIAIACLAAVSNAAMPVKASKACVQNSGGYAMYWWYEDIVTGVKSSESRHYAADHMECMDIQNAMYGTNEGDYVNIWVKASGKTESTDTALIYTKDAPAATYTCAGSTVSFQ